MTTRQVRLVLAAGLVVVLATGAAIAIGLWPARSPAQRADLTQTREEVRARCMFSAVDAYPSWGNSTPVIDSVDPCKGMPQEDKTLIRRMLADFVQAANQRSGATASATPGGR